VTTSATTSATNTTATTTTATGATTTATTTEATTATTTATVILREVAGSTNAEAAPRQRWILRLRAGRRFGLDLSETDFQPTARRMTLWIRPARTRPPDPP
jgi:hypothetical protein